MIMIMMMIPILVVLAANVMTQGVVVHKLQQPVPVVLLHIATVHWLTLVAPVDKVDLLVGQAVRTPLGQ